VAPAKLLKRLPEEEEEEEGKERCDLWGREEGRKGGGAT
jgi:hypothetical protein